ncbi:MAG: hypothetical protein R2728_09185 [Chitinophagales bacterium]
MTWEDGNEYPLIKMEISNTSHPFFTENEVLSILLVELINSEEICRFAKPSANTAEVAEAALKNQRRIKNNRIKLYRKAFHL